MHPATLGRLLDEVARLVAGKAVQVFLSTQSLEVLSWLALAMREPEQQTSLNPSDVCTLRLQLVVRRFQVSRLEVGWNCLAIRARLAKMN
jgi:hypothetical protein